MTAIRTTTFAILSLSGCMLSPTNQTQLPNRDQPLAFFGFHLEPDHPVRVEAFDVGPGASCRSSRFVESRARHADAASQAFAASLEKGRFVSIGRCSRVIPSPLR